MIIPNIWENKKWQPNHQPVVYPSVVYLDFFSENPQTPQRRCKTGHLETWEQLCKLSAWARSTFSSPKHGDVFGISTNLESDHQEKCWKAGGNSKYLSMFFGFKIWHCMMWYSIGSGLSCEEPPQGNPSHIWIVVPLMLGTSDWPPSEGNWESVRTAHLMPYRYGSKLSSTNKMDML